jgi:hypothetical protein
MIHASNEQKSASFPEKACVHFKEKDRMVSFVAVGANTVEIQVAWMPNLENSGKSSGRLLVCN